MLFTLLVNTSNRLRLFKQRGVTAIEYAVIGVGMSVLILAVFSGDNRLLTAFSGALGTIASNIGQSGS